ncbi:MAG: hypothetical protein A2015_04955 [Spirochaetes bacterium GWF1_31_7]|nr:MAG: hypothetical protein A2Y30_05325 [Spirochaetes bacterium GWE1_32_154]OHD48813.1 MAG: hypothetical protein A2Y29_03305 [Spirochaetes bacterium GWE2_31_10]OHD52875.1 MAG: hypothetical protein A2015_04955 [Spirochaetes bacterium GWF1_31_7]HBD94671.1 hypothetical protein [Spirochaetia bacterium]HBI37506.1 hypothetical protein [Spirochaetia bacterium]
MMKKLLLFLLILTGCSKQIPSVYLTEFSYNVSSEDDYSRTDLSTTEFIKSDYFYTTGSFYNSLPAKSGFLYLRFTFSNPGNGEYALFAKQIVMADEVYLNGEKIGSTGRFPPYQFSEWNRSRAYILPGRLLKDENTLIIKIYYSNEKPVSQLLEIGDREYILTKSAFINLVTIHLNSFIAFFVLLSAIHFFILFFLSGNKKIALLYSFICIFSAIYLLNFFITSIPGFTYLKMDYLFFQKIIFTCQLCIVYGCTNFAREFIGVEENKYLRIAINVLTLIGLFCINIAFNYDVFFVMRSISQGIFLLLLLYITVLIIRYYLSLKSNHLFFISLSATLVFIYSDFMFRTTLSWNIPHISGIGFTILILATGNSLSKQLYSEKFVFKEIAQDKTSSGIINYLDRQQLSPREYAIANLLIRGLHYKDIAYNLQISIKTVEWHIRNLYKKLHIGSRVDLMHEVFTDKDIQI